MIDTPDPSKCPIPRVLAVVGPTGVGKSALGELLARRLDGEIISADSMQVYRGMDIGTAKTPQSDRSVPYHCVDLVSPGESYSAARYQTDARAAIDLVASRAQLPILVGGTGLYVRAALDDLRFPAGEARSPLRERLEREAELLGVAALHQRLERLDPASAALIHPNNVRRTVRALEMAEEGVSYAAQVAGLANRHGIYDAILLGLSMRRDVLYERIDARVDAMIAAGLIDEVRGLLEQGFRDALTAASAIGYKELVPVLERGDDPDEAVTAIKQASRRYAKRQLSWFNADPRIVWIDVTDLSPDEVGRRALGLVESGKSSGTD
ncbi:MAG: tRNA (adenosine(37)-N6)-dimethylallyltransferase MiaA [Coriobacteriia bacterium]